MSIESAICKLIKDNAVVADKIKDRVFSDRLPDGAKMPAICYTGPTTSEFGKTKKAYDGFVIADFRIEIWGDESDKETPRQVRDALVRALHAYTGDVTVETETFEIQLIKVTDAGSTGFEEPSRRSRQKVELEVHYFDIE